MRRESCSRCGGGTLQRDLVDVVITVRGDKSYDARWCKPCAAECESKSWFAYAKGRKMVGPETDTTASSTQPDEDVREQTVQPPTSSSPKKVSGWQLMKAKYPTAVAAKAGLEAAKSTGKSPGTIKLFEGLFKMRQKEESQ